jgi:hypothetical protein
MNTINKRTATTLINAILLATFLPGCATNGSTASEGAAPATEIRDASRDRCSRRPSAHRKGCGRTTG